MGPSSTRCALRLGNVPLGARLAGSAGAGRGPLSGQVQAPLGLCRCRVCRPGDLRVPGGRRVQVCDPIARQSGPSREDRISAQATGRSPAESRAAVPRQLQLSGQELEQEQTRSRQGRVASGRAFSNCRLYRHQHDETGRAGRRLLQSTRHRGAVDQGRHTPLRRVVLRLLRRVITTIECKLQADPEP